MRALSGIRYFIPAQAPEYVNQSPVINLNAADLSGADLRMANLSGAILIEVNLSFAKLGFSKLTGANLSKAT